MELAEQIYREIKDLNKGTYSFDEQMVNISHYVADKINDIKSNPGVKVVDSGSSVILTESEYKKIMLNLAFNKSGDIGEGAKVIRYIQHLEAENKKLKCCGNCRFWADSINGWYCTHSKKDTSKIDFRNSRCGNWSEVSGL